MPLIPKSSTITNADSIQFRKECSKFAYEDLKEVHKRRHILQVNKYEISFISLIVMRFGFSLLLWNYLLLMVEIIYLYLSVKNVIKFINVCLARQQN